jgi:hypothetical protein
MSYPLEECHGGRLFEYRPQHDDPDFAVDIGPCPLWPGCGCEVDLPWPHGKSEPVDMEERCDDAP